MDKYVQNQETFYFQDFLLRKKDVDLLSKMLDPYIFDLKDFGVLSNFFLN